MRYGLLSSKGMQLTARVAIWRAATDAQFVKLPVYRGETDPTLITCHM